MILWLLCHEAPKCTVLLKPYCAGINCEEDWYEQTNSWVEETHESDTEDPFLLDDKSSFLKLVSCFSCDGFFCMGCYSMCSTVYLCMFHTKSKSFIDPQIGTVCSWILILLWYDFTWQTSLLKKNGLPQFAGGVEQMNCKRPPCRSWWMRTFPASTSPDYSATTT